MSEQETLARVTSCFRTLVRLTSCFQQLAASLGSSADCGFLRQEIQHAGALAANIAGGLSCHLTHLLSDGDSGPAGSAQRRALERVWVHLLSAAENFLRDLRKAGDLTARFPLGQQKERRSLVNTGGRRWSGPARAVAAPFHPLPPSGCLDGVVGVAARAASVQMPRLAADEDELQQWAGLQQHLDALEAMMSRMQLRVAVAFWSVEATQHSDRAEEEPEEEEEQEAAPAPVADEPSACCWPPARSGPGCAWS